MIKDTIKSFKNGEIVLIFDNENREKETDMIIAAEHVTPEHIKIMRNDAGGLICTPISSEISDKLRIPFMTDIMKEATRKYPVLNELSSNDITYDKKSAFSITLNHRKTFTGITDNDRAYTIRELAHQCKKGIIITLEIFLEHQDMLLYSEQLRNTYLTDKAIQR